MNTKVALSSRYWLTGLLITSMLQGCSTRVLEPVVIPAMLIADTLPAGTPRTPQPRGYELALTAGYFPYMHVTPAKYRPDGQPRLHVRSLTVDGKPVEQLVIKESGPYGGYPSMRTSTNTPIEKDIVADIVEADGTALLLALNIGDVINPSEYLGGGGLLVQVNPGTVLVRTSSQSGCRSGFNVNWCQKGNAWAHVWERVPGEAPKYIGKIAFEKSNEMLPLDYEALGAKHPPSPTVEVAVRLEEAGGTRPPSRCLTQDEFSLELNGAPAQLKAIELETPREMPGQCPRFSLLSALSDTAQARLTVRLAQGVRVYEGTWSMRAVESVGSGLAVHLPAPPAPALILRTPRRLANERDGTYRWKAVLPGNPQFYPPVGGLRLVGGE